MAQTERSGFLIYHNSREILEALTAEQRGELLMALLDYSEHGRLPQLRDGLQYVFIMLRGDIDRNEQRWQEECRKRSEGGKKSAALRAAKKITQNVSCSNDIKAQEPSEEEDLPDPAALPQGAPAPFRSPEGSSAPASNKNQIQNQSQNQSQIQSQIQNQRQRQAQTQSGERTVQGGSEADFARFWAAYPRKVGKEAARRAFARAAPSLEQLLAALERQKQTDQWRRDRGRYIPNPATWLSQGRWEDELSPAPDPRLQALPGIINL